MQQTLATRAAGFLHRLLFKVVNRASPALVRSTFFAILILLRSVSLSVMGMCSEG